MLVYISLCMDFFFCTFLFTLVFFTLSCFSVLLPVSLFLIYTYFSRIETWSIKYLSIINIVKNIVIIAERVYMYI